MEGMSNEVRSGDFAARERTWRILPLAYSALERFAGGSRLLS